MARKSKPPLTASEILEKIRKAGISATNAVMSVPAQDSDPLDSLDTRVRKLLSIFTDSPHNNPQKMLIFIMYDIESNKVRNLVAKYLIRQGCFRIQHSIYLADLPHEKCAQIKEDLVEVQAAYDNHDSILVVPISTDYLRSMKVIGKAIDIDVIMQTQNTLFF